MDLVIIFKAFILGLVEGATEFLPVSSTGHLIVASDLLNVNDGRGKIFTIVIQLGAILAVCWEYRTRLYDVLAHAGKNPGAQRFMANLALAFLPAAIIGVTFHDVIKDHLFSPVTVAIALIVGGFAMLWIEKNLPVVDTHSVDEMDWKHALKVGFAQSFALIPGISRAGATIMGGLLFGLSRKAATEFSFFLAIPIMFAATGYDLFDGWQLLSADDIGMFAVGFITSFFAALFAVKGLLRYVAHNDFHVFAWYRIILGILVLAYFWH